MITIRGRYRHCGEKTWQVGASGYHCLQCLADGGGCCSLTAFNRWAPNPTRPPR
ncbi:MAG: hypothetical protein M3364_09760 [Actinomycetota bacterium]|nr:hypothetical protein [Actinomycetota bacterium]